ncbi:hypothetical protein M9H77_12818 [Catharanthus roseus]|uniref:Uncharacterized protein n=1 Tax=Catharanthus roseus TaxID=4058 RepID=A0ACC0BIE4_CATRO|nr:hypothetical protein M9H77_12818 [Catharanthus roseus]
MFIRIHQMNNNFFHLICIDDEGRLDSVFWIQDVVCDYYWSQPSWLIHIVWFNTPISGGQRDIYLSMGNAVKEVMPTIIRQYCIWHIMCKLPNKFKGLLKQFRKARKEFRSFIYDNLTKSMFENNWNQFVAKF